MTASSAWTALASRWDELFPLRALRLEMCAAGLEPGDSFLDAGCGSGALVRGLLERGFDAYGLDLDEGFVAVARESLGRDPRRIERADLRDARTVHPGVVFRRIACLGQTFPHLLEDASVAEFLAGARERLRPDGTLLLQVVSDAAAPAKRHLPVLEVEGLRLERTRILDGERRAFLELSVATRGGRWRWRVEHRRWTPEALEEFAGALGYAVASLRADESGAAWTGVEPGWILELVPTRDQPAP